MKEEFWGKSVSINLRGCNKYISSTGKIRKFIAKLCREIKMTRHGPLYVEKFGYGDLLGYSCMQFIETSSITCHFDEKKGKSNRAFIDIFSCKNFDEKKALKFCAKFFKAESTQIKIFIRR